MSIVRLDEKQKIRLISGSMHLQTTVGKVRSGLGDSYKFNAATQKAVDALEFMRSGAGSTGQCTRGIRGTWEDITVQLDLV